MNEYETLLKSAKACRSAQINYIRAVQGKYPALQREITKLLNIKLDAEKDFDNLLEKLSAAEDTQQKLV